ncbi:MAG: DUF177 domain-containing protein [Coriobacteriia bacterium]|nr:DUF177 domain-containing protein [Coriobacteriia bacterium]
MTAFLVDISDILDTAGLSEDIEGELAVGEIRVGDERFVLVEPARVMATLSNAGSGFVATGTVVALVNATCSRCLCEFATRIEAEIEAFFVPVGEEVGEDDEGTVSEDDTVDLGPALLAALIVEAPFAPVHDEECHGLCAHCGADLNVDSCGCGQVPDADHPFASLAALVEDPVAPGTGE